MLGPGATDESRCMCGGYGGGCSDDVFDAFVSVSSIAPKEELLTEHLENRASGLLIGRFCTRCMY